MKRKESWPEDLNNYLASIRTKPFSWKDGPDCCTMPADAAFAMTGEDFAAPFRGKYSDAAGAYKALVEFSGGGLELTAEKIAAMHGWAEIPTGELGFVQRSDICLLPPAFANTDPRFGGMAGICNGEWVAVMGEGGLLFTSLKYISRAWRIPS